MKTFKELLKEGTQILINGGIEEARLDAWLLLGYTAGITRAELFSWHILHHGSLFLQCPLLYKCEVLS